MERKFVYSCGSEIFNIFLKNTAKLFYDKNGDDDTIYTNYFKLIENHIMTDSEIALLDPYDKTIPPLVTSDETNNDSEPSPEYFINKFSW